jgi:tetratricopeptide (TPR) repeat protein
MPTKTSDQPRHIPQVMISSTFTDLKEHRAALIDVLNKHDLHPHVMEYDDARLIDVIDSSLQMVRHSAAYICVIGFKYGQTPEDSDRNANRVSITELEFNEAQRLGRPILLYIMGDDHPVRKADIEPDPDKQQKLNAFRDRAKKLLPGSSVNRVYSVFNSLADFKDKIGSSFAELSQHLQNDRREPAEDATAAFPEKVFASNIPIRVPTHFLGREDSLTAIEAALSRHEGRVAITALHGLRGIGKTTLAAAYAERHRDHYRATWWIRAQTEPTMRADLIGLGVRLGWVAADEKEEPALTAVAERLGHEDEGLLLIYDNAIDAASLKPYLPRGGRAHALVTSNDHAWRGIAEPVELRLWPKDIGADYLIARTGRANERAAAEALSEALGGLPLAHEQVAAYCERLNIAMAEYAKRFEAAPTRLMDDARHAPAEYHDGLTVAKTFSLAIDEAAKLHPAAEPLIVHAALLAPEPIPLFLFSEMDLGGQLANALADDGLDEAVAALRAFALVEVETVADERTPAVTTDCLRLHRLVRQVAAARRDAAACEEIRHVLIEAAAAVYPANVYNAPQTWPRARRLDALILALVDSGAAATESEASVAFLLNCTGAYRQSALAAYAQARPLRERALAILEKELGPEHPDTLTCLNNLAWLLREQHDFAATRPLYERALAIREKVLGPEHPDTAVSLSSLAALLRDQGDLAAARPLAERALAIHEKALGPEHPDTATTLSHLAWLLRAQREFAAARPLLERALTVYEKVLGPEHPYTAKGLNNFALL